jgi:hypothetical protein
MDAARERIARAAKFRRNSSAPGGIKIRRVEYFRDTGAAGFLRERLSAYTRPSKIFLGEWNPLESRIR